MAISTCCGCCSLQKGSIIIGFIHFIFGVVALIYVGINLSELYSRSKNGDLLLVFIRSATIGFLFYTIILLILAGVLIVGAINRVVNCVFFFVSMSCGNIIITISYFIYQTTFIFTMANILPVNIVIYFVSAAIGMSIHYYIWLVVYNFYQELITDKFQKIFQHNTINYSRPVVPEMVYN